MVSRGAEAVRTQTEIEHDPVDHQDSAAFIMAKIEAQLNKVETRLAKLEREVSQSG